ncbi:MAG: sugar ABC transporter substrate-binding protein [Ktedonobacteraceae bacterium]|nr:sugar ABC transporter substrate-binding protein [Ktedonobacteraceae bacterium]
MIRSGLPRSLLHVLCLLICSLIMSPFLLACGSSSSEHTTLVVWTLEANRLKTPGVQGDYARYLVSQFQKEHPNVTLKFEDHGWDEHLRQNLTAALLGGTAPDVVVGELFFHQFANMKALAPLDDVLAEVKNDLIPGTYQEGTFQGHPYTIPAYTSVFGFERNCKVLEQAGLDCNTPPQTWDELVQQARTVTQKGKGQYYGYTLQGPAGTDSLGAVLRLAVYLAQADAPLCKNDCSQPWFNNPKAVPVYQFIRQLNASTPPGLAFNPDEGPLYSQLFKQKTAFQIAGSWFVSWSKQSGCGPEVCRFSPVPLPPGGHPASILVANIQYAALKQSKHLDLAKEFLKFLTRPDVQKYVYPANGGLPSNKKALQELRPTVDLATQQFIDTLMNSNLQSIPQWPRNPQKIWTAYNTMLTKLLTTSAPIPQLLDEAQKAAEQAANS